MKKLACLVLYLLVAAGLALVGVGAGWHMALNKGPSAGAHDSHGHDEASGGDGGHDDLSEQALANLGVQSEKLSPTTFVLATPVPAEIRETPSSSRRVVAPVGGRVLTVATELGELVDQGSALVTILRDPFPRPRLEITLEVVTPETEDYHETKAELRTALKSAEILTQELTRVGGLVGAEGFPLVPRQDLIKLRYENAIVLQTIENLRSELRMHGLDAADVKRVEAGEDVPLNPTVWRALFVRNGLWNASADALLAALPEQLRDEPWHVAVCGELAVEQLATPELIAWLKETPAVGEHFASVAGLLQSGATIGQLRNLYLRSAFEETVTVQSPHGAPDWDVHSLEVRPGDIVSAGDTLLTVVNPRELHLVAQPSGSETAAILEALRGSQTATAESLVHGAAPDLDKLVLQAVRVDEAHQPVAYFVVQNKQLQVTERDGRRFRSWDLRPGQRYLLQTPREVWENVYVVPVGGIFADGAGLQVYARHGSHFHATPVTIRHRNHAVAVLSADSLRPGTEVVTAGAFALKLAMNAGSSGADPHAGHNH